MAASYERGDKRLAGSPFYDNVMLWAVQHQMVGVNMTYRLAPAKSVAGCRQKMSEQPSHGRAPNIRRFGGDPGRIVLMGHSAGATHVSSYLAHPEMGGEKSSSRRGGRGGGAILVSGTYDLKPEIEVCWQRSYFGSDTALWPDRSSIAGLTKTDVRCWSLMVELDVSYYIQPG